MRLLWILIAAFALAGCASTSTDSNVDTITFPHHPVEYSPAPDK